MARPLATVEGARRLRATLRAAGDNLDGLKAANQAVADVVTQRTRSKVPVRSGRLRGTVRGSGTKTAAVVRAGYKSLPYGGPIHWGWPARKIKAQPFMVDAAHETENRWRRLYEDAVNAELSRVKGK